MANGDGIALLSDARRASNDGDAFESSAWARLAHSADVRNFAANWLDIQCRSFEGVIRGVVVLRSSVSAAFAPVAVWPEGIEGSPRLVAVVERSLKERTVAVDGLTRNARRQDPVFVAHPVLVDDELYGTAALEIEGRPEAAVRELIQRLGFGLGWLEALARRKTFTSKARLVMVLELIATSLQHERFQAAATAVATELATTFGCERVSIGFMKGRHIQVKALSHSAAFAAKTNVVRAGEPGRITVATNMAGRGTNIRLAPGVAEIGGLHVLSTVRHDSRRIDRQLFGRCGRQGDPGSYQVVISLEDEIFHNFFKHRIAAVRKLFPHAGKPLPAWLGDRLVGYAQNAAERHHGRIRRDLLRSDDQLSDLLAFAGRSE